MIRPCKEYRARKYAGADRLSVPGGRALYYSPADLMRESSWYSAAPELAYRDYGAKIFFHIGEGDEVTVPSSKSVYLYNWGDWPLLFVGMDYDKTSSRRHRFRWRYRPTAGRLRSSSTYRVPSSNTVYTGLSGDGWSQVERGCVGYRAA